MTLTAEIILAMITACGAAAGAYAAIRIDLARLHETTAQHGREIEKIRAKLWQ